MATHERLTTLAFDMSGVKPIGGNGRDAVRASEDVGELLALQASLRDIAAGRSLWVLWTVLLSLTLINVNFATTGDASLVFLFILGAVFITIVLISYGTRHRNRAKIAGEWLVEVDFRLAQLAARG
jgi:hypothetical protein